MSDATVDRRLVRLSIGVEGIDDLIQDVNQAIEIASRS
jgi:cystathionine beta-lyase/cystathionine gamma-synthase